MAGEQLFITEDPLARIQFLETTLGDTDWRATVVLSEKTTGDPHAAANDIIQSLRDKAYGTHLVAKDDGTLHLEIHHLGAQTTLGEIQHELGTLSAARQLAFHPIQPITRLFSSPLAHHTARVGLETLHDPARINGIVNTTAEVFMVAAGAGSQYGKFNDAKNVLLSISGLSWLSQSLTYLFFTKTNEDRILDAFKKEVHYSEAAGHDITRLHYEPLRDRESTDVMHRFGNLLGHYPIQIGAMMNNIGMGTYLTHAVLERRHHLAQQALGTLDAKGLRYIEKGFRQDVTGGLLSIAGWTVLLLFPPKKPDDTPQQHHFLGTLWEKFREKPQVAAGLLTLGASSNRLMGAQSKGNKWQQRGEQIYILGDLALMFTDSNEYGHHTAMAIDTLGPKLADYINRQPLLMGAQAQQECVTSLCNYVRDKIAARAMKEKSAQRNPEAVGEDIQSLMSVVERKIRHGQDERLDALASELNTFSGRFPADERTTIHGTLAKAISALPSVHVSADEMQRALAAAAARVPQPEQCRCTPKLKDVQQDIAALTGMIPGADRAVAAAALYDAVKSYMPQRPGPAIFSPGIHYQGRTQGTVVQARTTPPATYQEKLTPLQGIRAAQGTALTIT